MRAGKTHLLAATIVLAGLAALSAGVASSRVARPQVHAFHHENVLGTSLELKVFTEDEAAADKAEAAALAEIDRLAKMLSAWDGSSEFSRWMRTRDQAVSVSPELMEVLGLYDQWQASTSGALNAAAATANTLWQNAARANREPSASELQKAADRMQAPHWSLDRAAGTATHLDDAPLALASFTKGYIAGKAADAALAASDTVDGVVVNIGGDITARGAMAERVEIRDPRADAENDATLGGMMLQDASVATSGGYRRGVEIGGRHYSHIVDPRTARPVDHVLSSTVQAADPATAGALATAFSVLTPEESVRLASRYKGVEYLIAKRDGTLLASNGWRGLAFSLAPPPQAAPAAKGAWNPAFELVVNLALARVDDPRYRRPFVAVWIEDKDKFPVRTIALWYDKPRWLPDLKAWFRDDRIRSLAEGTEILNSVSSATRPPGKYTLKWDGKDNSGKPVSAGKYTVSVEASREHGTYQIIRHEMDFTGTPKQVQLPGGTEIESVSLDYRKAGN